MTLVCLRHSDICMLCFVINYMHTFTCIYFVFDMHIVPKYYSIYLSLHTISLTY